MSYTVSIRVRDGAAEIAGTAGDLPDGTWLIHGAAAGPRVLLGVTQHDAEGRFVTAAGHVLDRAAKALREAEDTAEAVTEAGGEAAVQVTVEGEISAGALHGPSL